MKWYVAKSRPMWIWIVCAAAAVALIITISVLVSGERYEDINGADTSLAVITLEDILAGKSGSSAFMVQMRKSGAGSGVGGILDDVDVQSISYSCKEFNGIQTIHATMPESDRLKLFISAKVLSGNLEVIVMVDGEYYCHVSKGMPQQVELEDVAGKLVEVRIAGESAEIALAVRRVFPSE